MSCPSKFARRRRGTTLAESMIASVLLATCVVGITGSITASYQNQVYAQSQRQASGDARRLMENLTALPLDPAAAGQPSLSDYQTQTQTQTQTNQTALGKLLSGLTFNIVNVGVTTTTTTTTTTSGAPKVSVDRLASINGAASATGDFAIVTVEVPVTVAADGTTTTSTRKLRRLVTSVESTANQMP